MQKRVESLREEKARVLCEDQTSGVILPFLLEILQEGRRKEVGQWVPSDLRYVTKPYKVVFDVWVRKTLIHP